MKKVVFSLLFIILAMGLVSSLNEQKCGDSYCNAGQYNINGNEIEDASTCFKDCAWTDYVSCDVSLSDGGVCNFRGINYQISNVKITSDTQSNQIASLTVSFNGHTQEINGITGYYVPLADYVQILVQQIPLAMPVTTDKVYLQSNVNPLDLNDFFKIENTNLNLKTYKQIEIKFTPKSNVSAAYCKFQLKNSDGQIITESNSGCNDWTIPIEGPSFIPGKYVFIGQLLDKNAQNKLGEKTVQINMNECFVNKECSDNSLFTIDTCIGNDVKTCSYKTNYLLIGGIISGILLILIILFLVFRKKK